MKRIIYLSGAVIFLSSIMFVSFVALNNDEPEKIDVITQRQSVPSIPQYAYLTTENTEIHLGYDTPEIVWRMENGYEFPYLKGTENLVVAMNKVGDEPWGEQLLWNYDPRPEGLEIIDVPNYRLIPEKFQKAVELNFDEESPDSKNIVVRMRIPYIAEQKNITIKKPLF
jgi:hypothetical protein